MTKVSEKAAEVLLKNGLGQATGLGLLLRQHRLARNLTTRQAAQAAATSSAQICEMELGKRINPTLSTIRALTKLYKLKPSVWFE